MESGMDSKACSLGRDEALVSTPQAQALLWIITPLSGATAFHGRVHVRMLFWLRQKGGVTDTQKKLLILMSFFNIGGLSILNDK